MPLSALLGLIIPVVLKVGGLLLDRVWKHGYSSMTGTAVGATVFGILQTHGCDMSHFDQALIALLAAVPGLVSTDAGKTSKSIPVVVQETIAQVSMDNM